MRARVLLIVSAGLLVAADVAKDDAIGRDLKTLDGTWTVVSTDWGDAADKDRGKGMTCVIAGERVVIKFPGEDKPAGALLIRIDPTQKPKALDLRVDESPLKSVDDTLKEPPVLAIYELDGDTLKVCWVRLENRERPKAFPARPASGQAVIVLKRVKP